MKLIKRIVENIKKEVPTISSSYLDVTSKSLLEFPANLDGYPVKRLFMVLPSKGCEWALERGGNCTPCGALYYSSKDKEIPKNVIFNKFKESYESINWREYPVLSLCNCGSFLSDKEIPADVKYDILEIIEKNKDIKKVIIESLPYLVTHQKIRHIKSLLKSKKIEVGIGLDAHDDYIRFNCLNKNITLDQYKKATNVIKDDGLSLLTYVHIKPPFLTEKEAIDEAIISVNYAFENNTDAVSLEPIFVMKYTLVHFLYQRGMYRPPWLWSVLEVLEKTKNLGEIRVNINENFETTRGQSQNYCKKNCSSGIRKKIFEYNRSLNANMFNNLYCECKNEWEKECTERPPYSLKERIKRSLEDYDR